MKPLSIFLYGFFSEKGARSKLLAPSTSFENYFQFFNSTMVQVYVCKDSNILQIIFRDLLSIGFFIALQLKLFTNAKHYYRRRIHA